MKRKVFTIFSIFILCTAIWTGFRLLFSGEAKSRTCGALEGQPCQVWYLLNLDGMKGLGHSALMLVDENGEGRVFSYNGMQYDLIQCLMGKEGIGKMKQFFLSGEQVEALLETGKLQAGAYEECDDFDRGLYRWISREQYDRIAEEADRYMAVGDEFERLYAELHGTADEDIPDAGKQMELFLAQSDIPRYQIYTHNCDTAARELIALVDDEVAEYNLSGAKLTPGGNYKNMCRRLSGTWGYTGLGEDSLPEKLLR